MCLEERERERDADEDDKTCNRQALFVVLPATEYCTMAAATLGRWMLS